MKETGLNNESSNDQKSSSPLLLPVSWHPQPQDPVECYIRAFRLFSCSRLNITLVDDQGSILALSPLAIHQSRWPFPLILKEGIPETSRVLYLDPAEEAWARQSYGLMRGVKHRTLHRRLLLDILHVPMRHPGDGRFLSLVLTSHLAGADAWQPPVSESEDALLEFRDLLQTQAVLWSEATAFLNASAVTDTMRQKAARIAGAAGSRLEAILDAALASSSTWHQQAV